jgi:hypothetical protein
MSKAGTALGFGSSARESGERTPRPQAPHSAPGPGSPPEFSPQYSAQSTVGCELAAEVLRSFGRLRLRVVGSSMLPTLWPGDLISVSDREVDRALPGDLVVFRLGDRLVTHRVVEVRKTKSEVRSPKSVIQIRSPESPLEFVTRGDALSANDPPVSSQDLLGRVVAVERGVRRHAPRQSPAGRVMSWIFGRSELVTRVALGVRRKALESRDSILGTRDTG